MDQMSQQSVQHGAWNDGTTLSLLLHEISNQTCLALPTGTCHLRRQGVALLQQALTEPNQQNAQALAQAALRVDPYCLVAYLVLAYLEPQLETALRVHEVGLRQGRRHLKAIHLMKEDGTMVSPATSLPYLRLLQSYVLGLLQAGRWEAALTASQQLMHTDPQDPLGIREVKIPLLLLLGYWDRAAWQLQRFAHDSSLTLLGTRAYLAFVQRDYSAASVYVQHIQQQNMLVLPLLLGKPEQEVMDTTSVAMEAVYAYSQLFLLVESNPRFREFCQRILVA